MSAIRQSPRCSTSCKLIYYYHSNRTDSLAVLPFTYTSISPGAAVDADAEYLSDGITDMLINNLSQLPDLKVIARSSVFRYKEKEIDPQAVGRALVVRTILTGKITQRGGALTISAELVDVENSVRLWGNRYE